jgi:anaerobic glycerol-3-phosphate dehydrogenase C subunit
LASAAVKEALDLCLACKSCKAECPTTVDMAKLKYEVQHQVHQSGKVPLRDWLLGHAHMLNRMGAAFAPLSNWVMRLGITKLAQHHLLGIHKNRTMPAWARPTFRAWWRRRGGRKPGRNGPVVLFHETLTDYNSPEIGQAAVRVLEAAGFEVIVLEKRKCCGRPLLSKGFVDEAREHAKHNVALLVPYAQQGIPIVGCEPSCMTMFMDDYRDLLPGDETELVAENSYLITGFLTKLGEAGRLELDLSGADQELLVHSHCHEQAVRGVDGTLAALELLPNARVQAIDAGCCGMAGSFGFEKEHYEFSLAVGKGRLFPAVQAAGPGTELVLTGTSCRDQVEHATGRRARHPIEVLADAL